MHVQRGSGISYSSGDHFGEKEATDGTKQSEN